MNTDFEVPYYAVIFTSILKEESQEYNEMAARMAKLCARSPGFLGMDHARSEMGISVCYWKDKASIQLWKENSEHEVAQKKGQENLYRYYKVQIAKVERAYSKSEKSS